MESREGMDYPGFNYDEDIPMDSSYDEAGKFPEWDMEKMGRLEPP